MVELVCYDKCKCFYEKGDKCPVYGYKMSFPKGILKSRIPFDWGQGDEKHQLIVADPRDRGMER